LFDQICNRKRNINLLNKEGMIFAKGIILGIITCLALFVFCEPSRMQTVNSSVEGLFVDQTRAPVPEAAVTLTSLQTGVVKATVSNGVGRYIFAAVPVGTYSLKVSKAGFWSFLVVNFDVSVGARITKNAVLSLCPVTQSVTVKGRSPVLQPSSDELGMLISPRSVDRLPLNDWNFLRLGLLAGAATDSGTTTSDFVSVQVGHPDLSIVVASNEQDLTGS
jgi:Carboxypeptidase regulatory-like domain